MRTLARERGACAALALSASGGRNTRLDSDAPLPVVNPASIQTRRPIVKPCWIRPNGAGLDMRWFAGICALFIGASVGGCAIIEAEKDNRGGFLDHVADDHWMKADSKKMRALAGGRDRGVAGTHRDDRAEECS